MARTGSHEVRDTAYGMNATLGVGFIPMAKGPRNLGIDFGSATLTHYGGAYLMHRFLTRLGVKAAFAHDIRVVQRNHRFSVGEMLLALLYPMVLGLERIETTQLLQQNGVFQFLTGLRSYPDPSTLRRFLLRVAPVALPQLRKLHVPTTRCCVSKPRPGTSGMASCDPGMWARRAARWSASKPALPKPRAVSGA